MSKVKKASTYLKHYLPLLGIFLAGILGFLLFSYDRSFQIVVMIATAISYVLWGVVHHHLHKDLDLSVVVEYVVIALLGVIIVASIVYRA